MSQKSELDKWHIIGASVTGPAHNRHGLPNQDSFGWKPKDGSSPLVVAVADGHGSPKSFHSHVGSRLAIESAISTIEKSLSDLQPAIIDESSLQTTVAAQPPLFVSLWREHVSKHQPSVSENLQQAIAKLEKTEGLAARKTVEANPFLPYGTTLLTVLVTERNVICWQIGDGDILMVSPDGNVTRPVPLDSRLLGNETTSLCLDSAANDFRFSIHPLDNSKPPLIIVSSDGYSNSFVNDDGFLQAGRDFLELLREDGVESVRCELRTWLEETAASGSGDDTTLCMVIPESLVAGRHKTPLPAFGP